jgi:hypothetical protein
MMLLWQMCVQWKKPEVSIMYLRGEISILVLAVFSEIVAILTAPAVLGLCSSWGTSQKRPSWSPSEHKLTLALSPFGARVRSHAIRRRLFLVLMTAAHISPNVFSLWKFLSNIQELFLTVHDNIIHAYYTSHLYAHLHLLFHMSCSTSLLQIFMAGWLPSAPCVRYKYTV